MSLSFSKLFFLDTPEEHPVLLMKVDLPDGPAIQTRIDFETGPETKTEVFSTIEERDSKFRSFLGEEARHFFNQVVSFRNGFLSQQSERYHRFHQPT